MASNNNPANDPNAAGAIRNINHALVLVDLQQKQLASSQRQLNSTLSHLAHLVNDAHLRGIEAPAAAYAELDRAGVRYHPHPSQGNAPLTGVATSAHPPQRHEQGGGRRARTPAVTNSGAGGEGGNTVDAENIAGEDGRRTEHTQQEPVGDAEEDGDDPIRPGQRLLRRLRSTTLRLPETDNDGEEDASSAPTGHHHRLRCRGSATPAVDTYADGAIRTITQPVANPVPMKAPQKPKGAGQTPNVDGIDKSTEILGLFTDDASGKHYEFFCFICGCNANSKGDYFASAQGLWSHIKGAHGPPDPVFSIKTGFQIKDVATTEYVHKVILPFCLKWPSDDEVANYKKHGPPRHHKQKYGKGVFYLPIPQNTSSSANQDRRAGADGSSFRDGKRLVGQYTAANPGKKAARKTVPQRDMAQYNRDSDDEGDGDADAANPIGVDGGTVTSAAEVTARDIEAVKTLLMISGSSEDADVTRRDGVRPPSAPIANANPLPGGSTGVGAVAATDSSTTALEVPALETSSRLSRQLVNDNADKLTTPLFGSESHNVPGRMAGAHNKANAAMSQPKSLRPTIAPILTMQPPPPVPGTRMRSRRDPSVPAASQGAQRIQSRAPTLPPPAEQNPAPAASVASKNIIEYHEREGTFFGYSYNVKHLVACPVIVDLGDGWRKIRCITCGHNADKQNTYMASVEDMLNHIKTAHEAIFKVWQDNIGFLLMSCTSTKVSKARLIAIQAGDKPELVKKDVSDDNGGSDALGEPSVAAHGGRMVTQAEAELPAIVYSSENVSQVISQPSTDDVAPIGAALPSLASVPDDMSETSSHEFVTFAFEMIDDEGVFHGIPYAVSTLHKCPVVVYLDDVWSLLACSVCGCNATVKRAFFDIEGLLTHFLQAHPLQWAQLSHDSSVVLEECMKEKLSWVDVPAIHDDPNLVKMKYKASLVTRAVDFSDAKKRKREENRGSDSADHDPDQDVIQKRPRP